MSAPQFMPYLLFTPETGENEVKNPKLLHALLAELLGTMFLVLVGCGSCMGADTEADVDFVRIALAFGVTVATMAQSIGHISGCNINPAITAGLIVGRKVGIVKGFLYIIAQCIGAIVGAGLLQVLAPETMNGAVNLGKTGLGNGVSQGQGVAIEFLITFVLVMVVFGAAADEDNQHNVKGSAPLAIGLSITACHLFAIPFTGSSMNPARSFGPAAVGQFWENHWVYWVGPILGGMCAGMLYQMAFRGTKPEPYSSIADAEEKHI